MDHLPPPPPKPGAPVASPALRPPQPMTLPQLQAYVRLVVHLRGHTTQVNEIFILLVEEVGEIARELKHRAFYPERHQVAALGLELADVVLYLMDLANVFGVDLETLMLAPQAENGRGSVIPHPARLAPGMGLGAIAAHLETQREEPGGADTPEMLCVLLAEEVGEMAKEVRKHWKGKTHPARLGAEVMGALTHTLRLAHWFGVDIEAAITEKEAINAGRTWEY